MRCIDADTLEKILEKIPAADIKNMGGQAYVLVKLSQVFNVIDNQPTIEPQRKKGKWVGYDGDWLKTMCKCSECGAMIDINEKYRNFFCYHCGARMESES